MTHTNLTLLTQQILMLPYPEGYSVMGLEPLSVRPYSFSMILTNSKVNRTLTLEVEFEGALPRFFVKSVSKVPVERFELMKDFARVFDLQAKRPVKVVQEDVVEVHSVHIMNQQKERLKNHLSVMLTGIYQPVEVKVTHNDGISAEGYFVYLNADKHVVRGFKLDVTGKLAILDFKTHEVVATHEAATMQSGYSAEGRAAAALIKEKADEAAREAEEAAMSPEEKRRLYSKRYYDRQKGKK